MKLSRRNKEERYFSSHNWNRSLLAFQRILAFRPQINLYCHIIQLKEKSLLGNNADLYVQLTFLFSARLLEDQGLSLYTSHKCCIPLTPFSALPSSPGWAPPRRSASPWQSPQWHIFLGSLFTAVTWPHLGMHCGTDPIVHLNAPTRHSRLVGWHLPAAHLGSLTREAIRQSELIHRWTGDGEEGEVMQSSPTSGAAQSFPLCSYHTVTSHTYKPVMHTLVHS